MDKPEALRLADALMETHPYPLDIKNAADELRLQHGEIKSMRAERLRSERRLLDVEAENETLKKTVEALAQAVARLQQHHATAWNRGHTMGMKANEDTARRALDAVKQDAWGNTMLTEALLKSEAQRDALLEALERMAIIIDKMGDMPDGFIHPSPWRELKCEEALTQARAAIALVEGRVKAVEEGE